MVLHLRSTTYLSLFFAAVRQEERNYWRCSIVVYLSKNINSLEYTIHDIVGQNWSSEFKMPNGNGFYFKKYVWGRELKRPCQGKITLDPTKLILITATISFYKRMSVIFSRISFWAWSGWHLTLGWKVLDLYLNVYQHLKFVY